MPLIQQKSVSRPANIYISLIKDDKAIRENIRISSNRISILDDDGQIIQQIVPAGKILAMSLDNEQTSQRSIVNNIDNFINGMNMTVLYVGASFSGKQKYFDGNKSELPMSYYFVQRLFSTLKQKSKSWQIRMKAGLVVKQKIYDCNSDNKYGNLKVKESDWEGVDIANISSVPISNADDCKKQLQKVVRQKNKLVLQFKDLYTSYLSFTLVRQNNQDNNQGSIIATVTFIQVPGVQLLAQSHSVAKNKQSSLSTKSLFNFAAILNQLNKDGQSLPQYNSVLGSFLKQSIGGNSQMVVFFSLKSQDIPGSQATIKFLKLTEGISQYPIFNRGTSFGLLRKFRAQLLAYKGRQVDKQGQQQKGFLQNQILKVKSEDDYARLLEKYSELKNKYNQNLKAKSEAQLQLIRCEQQKLQIGKSLVEVQIQNTKLLQKLQNKDYENGKKLIENQNKLAKKQIGYQESQSKIQQLNEALAQALQTKRDLQVQFVALKRNFIMQQKQIKTLKQDNQNLSLDVVNFSNENQRLKKDFMMKNRPQDKNKMVIQIQNQKLQQLKRQNKQHLDNINYLKGQMQRYKKQLIQRQVNFQSQAKRSGLSNYGKDYDRIQLQNQKNQLQNRLKLLQRRIEQLQQKTNFYEQQNNNLQQQNKQIRTKQVNQTNQYRKKLQQLAKGTNYQLIVKQLRQNFSKKDNDNLAKINLLKKQKQDKKKQISYYKSNIRQLLVIMEEWAPKGVDLPALRKFKSIDLTESNMTDDVSELRVKNLRLEQEVRRLKASNGNVSVGVQPSIGRSPTPIAMVQQSRVRQEYDYLKNSQVNGQLNKLKQQYSRLAQENRRLTVLLKDGNKMDLNVAKRQSQALRRDYQNLKRQNDLLKNQSSVSPSTNEQKIAFYQKHLKALQKQRSQLISRCTVAQQQVKNLLSKLSKVKQ